MAGKFIDSHAHLDDKRFDADRDELINSLYDNDVEAVLNPGADLKSSKEAVLLAEKYPFIYAAVGCHPHDTKFMNDDTMNIFRNMAKSNKVIGIGEIGLDYYYDNSDRDTQKRWFREQIRLAKELDLPYIVHDRDAHEDILRIMKEEYYDGVRGILHCDSGSVEYLTPEPYRGKRNEPRYVKYVAEEIAKIRNVSIDECAEKTKENFKALFNL